MSGSCSLNFQSLMSTTKMLFASCHCLPACLVISGSFLDHDGMAKILKDMEADFLKTQQNDVNLDWQLRNRIRAPMAATAMTRTALTVMARTAKALIDNDSKCDDDSVDLCDWIDIFENFGHPANRLDSLDDLDIECGDNSFDSLHGECGDDSFDSTNDEEEEGSWNTLAEESRGNIIWEQVIKTRKKSPTSINEFVLKKINRARFKRFCVRHPEIKTVGEDDKDGSVESTTPQRPRSRVISLRYTLY